MDRLAVIGASYLQKPLVEKAREMGFETHVFAWEDGAVCRDLADRFYPISITDTDQILRVCREIQPRGVVSISSDLATIAVNRVAGQLGLIGNSLECTRNATNKFLMRERLNAAKLPCPRYWQIRSGGLPPRLSSGDFPVIVKPVDRSGSRGVALVNDPADLATAVDAAARESFAKDVIIEQYIEGREISVEAISWQGEHHVLQYTDKETTGAPRFIELAHHQPAELNQAAREEIAAIVTAALDALEIEYGASHSELRIDPQGKPWIIEIGARMGGDCIGSHLVKLSTGYDFVRGVIEVAVGRFQKPVPTDLSCSGIHYLFPPAGYLKAAIFNESPEVVDHAVLAALGEEIPPITDSSQRPGYYIYRATKRMPFDPGRLTLLTTETA